MFLAQLADISHGAVQLLRIGGAVGIQHGRFYRYRRRIARHFGEQRVKIDGALPGMKDGMDHFFSGVAYMHMAYVFPMRRSEYLLIIMMKSIQT